MPESVSLIRQTAGLESHYEFSFGRGVEEAGAEEIDPEWSQEIHLSYRHGEEPYSNGEDCVAGAVCEPARANEWIYCDPLAKALRSKDSMFR